ncbi:MAG: Ldh family oxidoreductase [Actinocatenispora sp.]
MSEAVPAGAGLSAKDLTRFAAAIFTAVGLRDDDAQTLARSLVEADETGVSTHGLTRTTSYVGQLESGQVNPRPVERVLREGPASVLFDADSGFGAPVGVRAVDAAIDKAARTGVAIAGVTRTAHFGAAAFYTRHAAERGFLALAMGSSSPSVVPFGGRGPRIGNSPLSFASPGVQHPELVLDMAQSMSSRGRVKMALDAGETLPPGWAVDGSGAPTTDPAAALSGGILASGGHKGSALSLMVEMLASGLTGANLTRDITLSGFTGSANRTGRADTDVTVGNFYLVIDADVFGDASGVCARATAIAEYVRASEPAPGVRRVYAPGDIEADKRGHSRQHGIVLREKTWRELRELAARFGIPVPTAGTEKEDGNDVRD